MAKYLSSVLLIAIVACSSGCLAAQVRDKADSLATTTTDLVYQEVLDNLARLHDDPEALPYLDIPSSGTAQVQHEVQASFTPTVDFISAAGLYIGKWIFDHQASSIGGSQTVQESWSIAPLSNPDRILLMKAAYRRALGIARKGDKTEEALKQYYRIRDMNCRKYSEDFREFEEQFNAQHAKKSSDASKDANSGMTITIGFGQEQPEKHEKDGEAKPSSSLPFCIDYEPFSHPTGWFTVVHGRQDVPKDTYYMGRHGNTFVCVSHRHVRELSNFTLAIMDIACHVSFSQSGHKAKE